MHYKALATVIGVVALSIGGGAAAASGGGHGHWKKVHIEFEPTDRENGPPLPPFAQVCDPDDHTEPPVQCVSLRMVTVAQTGDLVGTTLEGGAFVLGAPGELIQSVAGTYTGAVNGCGSGGFRYTGVENFGSPTSVFSYTIVEGSGFGDLEGITGSFGTQLSENDEVFRLHGTVRCRQSR